MKRKLGINAGCICGVPGVQTLEKIKAAGFTCFFTEQYDLESASALRERADELALDFEFIHAPFKGINAMWKQGLDYLDIYNGMKKAINTAAACGVPTVILHLSSSWEPPVPCDLGWERFDSLVLHAKKKGVNIAFENLRVFGNLACAIERYEKLENVGFCLDFGHQHGYTRTVEWMDMYTNRAIATHIHDNHGRGVEKEGNPDEHLLPFDGNCDFAKVMHKLDEYGYEGSLMLEVFTARAPEYQAMSPEEFLAMAFERLERISKM